MRWSQTSVSVIASRATTRPRSSTAGFFSSAPTASSAACGGLMIAVKRSMPYMPRFETVKVPPDTSGGVILRSRTFSISGARLARDLAERLLVGVEDRGHHERASSAATATPTLTLS